MKVSVVTCSCRNPQPHRKLETENGLQSPGFFSIEEGKGVLIKGLSTGQIKQTPEESFEAQGKENVAVVPLAVPLLAGPAAISTVIIYTHRDNTYQFKGFLMLGIIFVLFLVWLSLRLSIPLSRKLGKTGLNNITRIMGLLLSAIAVEFIASGMLELRYLQGDRYAAVFNIDGCSWIYEAVFDQPACTLNLLRPVVGAHPPDLPQYTLPPAPPLTALLPRQTRSTTTAPTAIVG